MAVNTVTATVNGNQYTLTYNSSSGKYEATITSPSSSSYPLTGHYYPVSVTATDTAGNSATVDDKTAGAIGTALQLKVKEKTAPTISITTPTAGQYTADATPTITFTVTDSGSGVNNSTIALKVDSTSIPNASLDITGTGATKTVNYTPTANLADGSHTISINASDYDGNAATTATRTFNVLANTPTLSVTSPINGFITNATSVTLSGTTDGSSVAYVLDSGSSTNLTMAGSNFSKSITGLTEGNHTIVVTATGASGLTTSVTRTFTVDTTAPTISAVTITPNPVDTGATFVISVTVTD